MKVEISPFGGDKRVEEFLDWLAKCDWFYEYTRISDSRMVKTVKFKLKP
jgi:hypothetical protein